MSKTRTITLTNRPPVRIVEDAWPLVAQSDWRYGTGATPDARAQLRVRRNADGRALVYGTYQGPNTSLRAGELVRPQSNDVAAAIARTAAHLGTYDTGLPRRCNPDWRLLGDECVAALPAVTI